MELHAIHLNSPVRKSTKSTAIQLTQGQEYSGPLAYCHKNAVEYKFALAKKTTQREQTGDAGISSNPMMWCVYCTLYRKTDEHKQFR